MKFGHSVMQNKKMFLIINKVNSVMVMYVHLQLLMQILNLFSLG